MMIKSHGEQLGREKAVKDTKRYVFSGRLICGLCGGHMRRGKDHEVDFPLRKEHAGRAELHPEAESPEHPHHL